MTALTIQNVSRRSGLSEPTLRYYGRGYTAAEAEAWPRVRAAADGRGVQ
jgi:hypothetical protein